MKRNDGDYIEMEWDGDPQFEIVKGWVGEVDARRIIYLATGSPVGSFAEWSFRECYAAHLQTQLCRTAGLESEIRLYSEPGRGRFKASVLEPPKSIRDGKEGGS